MAVHERRLSFVPRLATPPPRSCRYPPPNPCSRRPTSMVLRHRRPTAKLSSSSKTAIVMTSEYDAGVIVRSMPLLGSLLSCATIGCSCRFSPLMVQASPFGACLCSVVCARQRHDAPALSHFILQSAEEAGEQ